MKNLKTFRLFILSTAFALCVSRSFAVPFVVAESLLTSPTLDPSTIVQFNEVASGTSINGLTIKGFTFSENIAVATATGGGPGNTNHITQPAALSGGGYNPATYVLTITMPGLSTSFGFGFAILNSTPTANALTITLLNGATNLGSLTYGGSPDPVFDGGFAGIGSTVAFNSAQITFGPSAVAFDIDNIAAISASVPDASSSLMLVASGLALLLGAKRARRRS